MPTARKCAPWAQEPRVRPPGLGNLEFLFRTLLSFFDPLGLSLINKYRGFEILIATTLAGLLFLLSSFLYIISTTFVSGLIYRWRYMLVPY